MSILNIPALLRFGNRIKSDITISEHLSTHSFGNMLSWFNDREMLSMYGINHIIYNDLIERIDND